MLQHPSNNISIIKLWLKKKQDYISSTVNNGTTDQHQQDGNGGRTSAADKRPQQPPSSIKTLGVAMLTKEILSLKRAVDQLTYVFSYIKQENIL